MGRVRIFYKNQYLFLTLAPLHGNQTSVRILGSLRECNMVDPKLGTKRSCEACEARFYDLNKNPAVCPKCGHSFDPTAVIAAVATRKIEPKVEPEVEDNEDELDDDEDALSLDAMVDDEVDDDDEEDLPAFDDAPDDDSLLDDDDVDDDDDDDAAFLDEDDDDI